jgi:4-amino-4-deoxy-L-arabinose transferase-like glycosyltransferase
LLLAVAAYAVAAAVTRDAGGTQWRLVVAGVCVGLAFQAKMLEAWLVLPALGLAYLASGPVGLRRRVREVVVAGLVAGVVSVAWMSAVSLVPQASRPYVDGSGNDSVYSQVFTHNGFGRLDTVTPLTSLNAELSTARQQPAITAGPGAGRLLAGSLGRDVGWLLPAAAVAVIWGIASRRRQARRDPMRAGLLLWGGWLATLWAAFSAITTINTYYTAALDPAVAAIVGIGSVLAWQACRAATGRRRIALAGGLAVMVAGTAGYAAWLVPSAGVGAPGWLVPAAIAVAVMAIALLLATLAVGRGGAGPARRDAVLAAAVGAVVVAGSLVPAVASAGLAARHESAFDTPFEPATLAAHIDQLPRSVASGDALAERLRAQPPGQTPYLMAAQTAALAAVFAGAGYEVLPIGGFTGSAPSPTLSQLQADIQAGDFRLVLGLARTSDPRMTWIAAHCQGAPEKGAIRVYLCLPPARPASGPAVPAG